MDTDFLRKNGVDIDSALNLFGDIETYNDTLKDFSKDAMESLNKLRKYKEISDMKNYSIYAHSIKSDAKYFGFTRLADIALKNEEESKNNNMFYVAENFNEFEKEIIRCVNIANKYLGEDTIEENRFNLKSDSIILVVDDSLVIKKFVDNIFNNKYNCLTAGDGKEAIDIINNNEGHIKMMLLDLNMPNFNGLEVLEYFKENNLFDKIPVTVITGVGDQNVLEKAREYPIKHILLKPFNEKSIKEVVEGNDEE